MRSSVGIYVHIPFCRQKCGYCSFYSVSDLGLLDGYVDKLIGEIKDSEFREADTIYFGGGTPSLLTQKHIKKIFAALKQAFSIATDAEISFEANPESCSLGLIEALKQNGVNRVSLGLQSHEDRLLKKIGRLHNFADFLKAVENLKVAGLENISADLIIGLEGQTQSSVQKSLEALLDLKHISVYALEDTLQGLDNAKVAAFYDFCTTFLEKNKIFRYEISNFAKVGYQSRHNKKYWEAGEYLGFGAAAHSFFKKEGNFYRKENSKSLLDYTFSIEKQTDKDLLNDKIMLSLRTREGIDIGLLKGKEKEIDFLLKNKFVEIKNNKIKIARDKFFIQNSIVLRLLYD